MRYNYIDDGSTGYSKYMRDYNRERLFVFK